MSLTDFTKQYEDTDPRSIRAREILDMDTSSTLLYKVPRAGCTTSISADILKRGETFTSFEPTNQINTKTLDKAGYISGTGKRIIPIMANSECILNQIMLRKHPDVRKLGILPIQQCEDSDGVKCKQYNRCLITRPLREVVNVGGYSMTYAKLVALSLSTGSIAQQILSTITHVDHMIFDECHELCYPDTVSVQIVPEIDMTKFVDIDRPMIHKIVSGFTDIIGSAIDAVKQIEAHEQEYWKQHLAIKITSPSATIGTKSMAASMRALVDLMIDRSDYDLAVDDVITLKNMMLLCAEHNHVVHGIVSTKSDGIKALHINIESTNAIHNTIIRQTIINASDQYALTGKPCRIWYTSGTIADMGSVIPVKHTSSVYGDPMNTSSMFAVVSDTYRISDKSLRDKEEFERVVNDIKSIVDRFGAGKCAVIVPSIRWYDEIISELEEYRNLDITWYGSDKTIGVESDRRIWIAVGLAEKPKNAMDALALSHGGDLVAMSDRLRVERTHIDTFQAWCRAKDPEGNVRSVVVALGCRSKDVENVVTWRINRKLEVSGVRTTTGGSRTHYDIVGGDHIGSEIQIIERGKNDVNELVERWLDNGDMTPLTMKLFNTFFERHKDEELTIRDIHQGMHLSRKGVKQKDTKEFLLSNGYPVTKIPYIT